MPATETIQWSPQSQWEIAFVFAFTTTFQPEARHAGLYPFPAFQPEDLEHALLQTKESELMDQILCSFLSNALNRKKVVEINACTRTLQDLISTKIKTFECDLIENPLINNANFHSLAPEVKLNLLRLLVEWQLQDCVNIHLVIDNYFKNVKKNQDNPLELVPFGYDSKKRAYFQFGDSAWLWREKTGIKSGFQWETVAKDVEGLQRFITENQDSKNRAERALLQRVQELIPTVEERQRRQEKKDRAKARQLAMELAFAPRELRQRDRKRPVRYNYDDFTDKDDYAQDDAYERVRPTRVSSRLNPGFVQPDDDNNEEEDREEDEQVDKGNNIEKEQAKLNRVEETNDDIVMLEAPNGTLDNSRVDMIEVD
ncbi:hypothetical protein CLU79DRAFT_771476 [Phycomyces nitens]|nr:hypothetical protein CLU79DRAFT_771476 [Phycomyces nitens]